ncbi:MAG: response regulator transcription factor [Actinomycetota bacterium]|nr:response regulator transcription factor [Actinomycetota bacterium]
MRVLVVDDRPMVQQVLADTIGARSDVQQVSRATSDSCLAVAVRTSPDLVVLGDVRPGLDVTACRELLARGARPLIVADADPAHVLELIEAGAMGVARSADGLAAACTVLDAVAAGQAYVPPDMLGGLLHSLIERKREHTEAMGRLERLSEREREVLAWLGTGADHAEIAQRLFISPHTAKSHIQRVLTKLQVQGRVAAAALAVEHGIVPADEGVHS